MPKRKKKTEVSGFFDEIRHYGKKLFFKIFIVCAFLFVLYSFFSGPYGFLRIYTLFREKENLEFESKVLEARIVDLETKKNLLKNDSFYIEKQARERLGMAKEGEMIYKFVDTTRTKDTSK